MRSDGTTNCGFVGRGDQVISGGSNADLGISTGGGNLVFGAGGTSEKARLDSSGRLLAGTSSSFATGSGQLQLDSLSSPEIALRRNSASSGSNSGRIAFYSSVGLASTIEGLNDGAHSGDSPGRLVFSTTANSASSPTARLRINNQGEVMSYSTNGYGINAGVSAGAGTTTYVLWATHSRTSPGDGGTNCFAVFTNGNTVNINNSYGAISDAKLKENIVDASSQWNDLKALQVRNYNFKEETGHETHTQLGVVAQEVELISPGLVTESPDRDEEGNDLGTVTKSVNYSVLYMKAVKALQEAQTRIETLESQHADLLARVTALEAG